MGQSEAGKLLEVLASLVEGEDHLKGGSDAGKLNIETTPFDKALAHMEKRGLSEKDIPNFEKNYKLAQQKAKIGWTRREGMPVITSRDVQEFQRRLAGGTLDIYKPASPTTDTHDPFPEGLKGKEAEDFVERGLKDGSKTDDIIPIQKRKIPVKDLKPIQKEIFFDKSISKVMLHGMAKSLKFVSETSLFITSSDNYIIDGHHRFLTAILLNPNMRVNCLSIDLPLKKLLPLSLAYGDAIGNQRNKSN
jgi:hypothetical protein